MQLSFERRQLVKRALNHYRAFMLSEKCCDNIPPENAKVEIQNASELIEDLNIVDKLEGIEIETPTGELIESLLDDVELSDMEIKPVKKC